MVSDLMEKDKIPITEYYDLSPDQIYSSRSNERQTYEATRRNAHLRKSMIQIKKFREANSRDISFCKKLIEANDRRS